MNRKMRRAEQAGRPEGENAPPSEVSAHIDLGNRHFIEGRLDQAIDCYLQAIGAEPDQMDAHHNLCAVLMAQGQFQAAIAHYEQILEFKPDYARAYAGLARALLNVGDAPRALDVLLRGLKISEFPESKFLFVVCLQSN
jgi:tetratricopeptide (TPR) repeat protein